MNGDKFFKGYIEAALWSSVDDQGEPLDARFDAGDLSLEARRQMKSDCRDFITANAKDLAEYLKRYGTEYGAEHAGHDFWLTRNGHGAGFWDRGLGAVGERLSDASKAYGSQDIYAGDDGKLYV